MSRTLLCEFDVNALWHQQGGVNPIALNGGEELENDAARNDQSQRHDEDAGGNRPGDPAVVQRLHQEWLVHRVRKPLHLI